MRFVIRKEPLSALSDYASIPIAFSTTTVLEVERKVNGLGGVRMVELPLDQPLTRDFDPDEAVAHWRRLGDISHWRFFDAFIGEQRVGGAVVAQNSPGIHMLEGCEDMAVCGIFGCIPAFVVAASVRACSIERSSWRGRPAVCF